jgi:hypothetical protein
LTLLDRQGVIAAEIVALDLAEHADAIPEQSRPFLLNLAKALRPMSVDKLTAIDGGKKD